MPRLRLALFVATCAALAGGVLRGAGGARAEDAPAPAPLAAPTLEDRAHILGVELRRGPAKELEPYLRADAHPALRAQAIRALGRIGDRAGATARIAEGLAAGGSDLLAYLEAAALSGAKSLEKPVLAHASAKDPAVAAAALTALGWIAGDASLAAVSGGLLHPNGQVVGAALEALGRLRQEVALERVLPFVATPQRKEAWFAAWMLAGARKKAALARDPAWSGESGWRGEIATSLASQGHDLLDVVRVNGLLSHYPDPAKPIPALESTHLPAQVEDHLLRRRNETGWRACQETIARLLGPRRGQRVEELLLSALGLVDPLTREAVLEAGAAQERSPGFVEALRAHGARKEDPRVLDALAVALAKLGDEPAAQALVGRKDRPEDMGARLLTEVRVLGASKRETAPEELVALALAHPDRSAVLLEACSLVEEKPGAAATKLIDACLGHADAFVRASAAGLVGKHKLVDRLQRLDRLLDVAYTHAEGDVRQAVVEAWVELLKTESVKDAEAAALKARIAQVATSDPSFTARAVAREAMTALKIDGCPAEDPLQPNDWKGLPRPKEHLLGIDLTQGTGPLTEVEILTLADRMAAEKPEFIVESDVGMFRLAIDPSEAPVHAVSFLLCVASGVYEGTPWHRVVPSFVIQGGDPHGTGSGDAGWHLPDEITRARFVRGALGMPKGSIRDTGGCQLFVMHSDYRPLDGRYTCYGRVTAGMDTVDKIRVGDRILRVGMVVR